MHQLRSRIYGTEIESTLRVLKFRISDGAFLLRWGEKGSVMSFHICVPNAYNLHPKTIYAKPQTLNPRPNLLQGSLHVWA